MHALTQFALAVSRPDHLGLETAFMEVMSEVYNLSFPLAVRLEAETPEKETWLAKQREVYRQLFPAPTGHPACPICCGKGHYTRMHPLDNHSVDYPCDCRHATRFCSNCAAPVHRTQPRISAGAKIYFCHACELELEI